MTAAGEDESAIASCDPMLFCDVPNWSVYAGPLPAAAAVRAASRAPLATTPPAAP